MGDGILGSNVDDAKKDSDSIFLEVASAESLALVPYTNQINDVADEMRYLYEELFLTFQKYASCLERDANDIYRMATDIEEFDRFINEQEKG